MRVPLTFQISHPAKIVPRIRLDLFHLNSLKMIDKPPRIPGYLSGSLIFSQEISRARTRKYHRETRVACARSAENPRSSFSVESRPVSGVASSLAYPGHAIRPAYLRDDNDDNVVRARIHTYLRTLRARAFAFMKAPIRPVSDRPPIITYSRNAAANRILLPQLLTNSAPGARS